LQNIVEIKSYTKINQSFAKNKSQFDLSILSSSSQA
jgi:hypothetical protein